MAPILYRASAPGSLMLLGEHAVLHDKPAIVVAIDKCVTVNLKPRSDYKVSMQSTLGILETTLLGSSLEECLNQKPFQYIIASIILLKELDKLEFKNGFELTIASEFSSTVGFGSSAAVTVATLAVLMQEPRDKKQKTREQRESLFKLAKEVILKVQGVGSGADAAASVFGGVVVYQQKAPYILKLLPHLPPLVAIYSGYKTPTVTVIKRVMMSLQKYPQLYEKIFDAIEQCVTEAIPMIEREDWARLGEIFNIQQGLMNALGVGTPLLNELIDGLVAEPTILGAKISGSGLGDCVIGLGEYDGVFVQNIPVQASLQGVVFETQKMVGVSA